MMSLGAFVDIHNVLTTPLVVECGENYSHLCIVGLLGGLVQSCLMARFPTNISVKCMFSAFKAFGKIFRGVARAVKYNWAENDVKHTPISLSNHFRYISQIVPVCVHANKDV